MRTPTNSLSPWGEGRGEGSRRRFARARLFLLTLVCALLPASAVVADRASTRSPISLVVRAASTVPEVARDVVPLRDPEVRSTHEAPSAPLAHRSWPRVRFRLYVWWRALLR
jgi:hypothetical protein